MAVTKVINSESKTYKPVLVDSLVLDAAPTVGSLNGVTSDGVAKAISGSGSVPTPAAGDDGKVLTANDGSYAWAEPTGTEYSAGTGITISEENAIAVTEAISNGAAAGATAVQPAALNDYALSSSLATVATTGAYSDLSGTPTIPTVDQTYNASSTNAQSGVAVAEAIAAIPAPSVDEVPDVGSTDDGKVLTAAYSGGVGSYSWQTAQGGGASYTAGNGIRIDSNDEISVKTDASLVSGDFDTAYIGSERVNTDGRLIPTQLKTLSATVSCSEVPAEVKASIVLFDSNSRYAVYDTDTVIGSYSDGNVTYTNNVVIDIPTDNSKWTFTGTPFDVSGKMPTGVNMYVCATGSTGSYGGMQQLPLKVDVSTFAFQRNHPELHVAYPIPTPDANGKVLTVNSSATYGYQWQGLPTWSSDYGASVDNSTHKINVTAITPADKQINVLGKTNVPNMTLNLVNPNEVPDVTNIPAYVVRAGEWGEDFDCVWISNKISSSRYPDIDHGSAVTLYLNIPNDVVLTGSYSGATLSSTGFRVYDDYGHNDINITSSVIDSSNILKIQAGRYAVTMNLSQVYNNARLCVSITSWLESGGNKVALDAADKTLILTAMEDWTFDCTNASGVHYEMDITAIPASTSADENKVLTVDSNGDPVWAVAQGGGGASYTASAPIAIESDDIKLNYDSTLSTPADGKFTVRSTSADANNTRGVGSSSYFNNGCYGLYVYNTGINLPKADGSLAVLYKKPSNYYQDMTITGAAAAGATGWTVVIYDPKAPTSNYCIANEEYEFAGVSGNDAIVFKTYSSADTDIYYKFTFSTANCHGTVTGDLLGIQIIPLPTSATSGTSCAGTTYLSMVNSGHSGNSGFAVYGTITPFSELPAANSGSFENTYTRMLSVSANAVKFDPNQFTNTTKSVIPAGAVGDTLGTYGYKGVKVNSAFYTGNPYGQDQAVHYSFKWAANGSWLYDNSGAFQTSQTLASDVRVLFYNISNPSQYCEFTGVVGLGFNWTDYTVGIIGNYWDRYGKCYGPSGNVNEAGYWSIDFTIDANTSTGTNTTYMDWRNIVTNTGYAICFYTPGTTGTAPNGCDYSSIPEAILAKFGTVQEAGLRKVQDKLLVPSSSSADNGKVLTVSSGNATWATPSVVPSDIPTAINAAVDVDTNNAVFTGDGDSVKMEFTRVTDTSSTHVGAVTLTSNTTENSNNIVFLIFDLDAGYKTFGTDFSPKVHISDAITGLAYFYGGYSATTTSGSIGSIATVSNNTVAAQDIDVRNTMGNNGSYKRRYLLIGAYSATGPAGYDALAAQLKASVSITGWPGDVYGTKVVIPNIPASTSADEYKVLTVNSSGSAVWAMPALGSVQSIQQVNALPANPDANTLYLIPET